METLLHPDLALDAVLKEAVPTTPVTVSLDEALDHVAAADLVSPEDVPATNVSLMDGFAVRSADIASATREHPLRLTVVSYLPAGAPPGRPIAGGEAARIMTGAPVPAGADAVVPIENTSGASAPDAATVDVLVPVTAGEFVFGRGLDVTRGQTVVPAGTLLRPQELGVLAAIGAWRIPVHRRPRVAILSTGDELVPPHEPVAPGKVRSANGVTLVAQARRAGAEPIDLGIVSDDPDAIVARLRQVSDADILVMSGGSAAGDRDYGERTLAAIGARIRFHRVAIRPGKPVLFAVLDRKLLFGLPGNPAAAALTFELFVRPAILKLRGLARLARRRVTATLQDDPPRQDRAKRFLVRVRLEETDGQRSVRLAGHQGSLVLSSLSRANAIYPVEPDGPAPRRGDVVTVWLLDDPEI